MPIKWKQSSRFNPAVVLKKIEDVRTVDSNGGVSFAGFEVDSWLPVLHSMLQFPPAAAQVGESAVVWRGIARLKSPLTPSEVLASFNEVLAEKLSTKDTQYCLLTAISLDRRDLPARLRIADAHLTFLPNGYPRLFRSRDALLRKHPVPVEPTPENYCKVLVRTKAKFPDVGARKALRALDLHRALWCLMGNPEMQFTFGAAEFSPVNVVRVGSVHTLHLQTGEVAASALWFEPSFSEAKIFRPQTPNNFDRNCRWALRQISACPYGDKLEVALVRYARAFDDRDANSAFLGLWGALEGLTSQDQADYQKTVRRCSFLYEERAFHTQVLEHLREYRNVYIHAGEARDSARTHCFQLQSYFSELVWFHVRNARFFRSLEEANEFLDSPHDSTTLKRRAALARRAARFVS